KSLNRRSKIIIFHDPELFLVATLLRLCGRHVIYDCHENVHLQVMQKSWIPSFARAPIAVSVRIIEWFLSSMMSGVIAATPSIAKRFSKNRTVLVRNFPTTEAIKCLNDAPPIGCRKNVVIYSGCLSRVRGIKELTQAFQSPALSQAELWLVGNFDDAAFENEILASAPSNVRWLGWMEHNQVLQLYKHAKLGIVLLYPTPSHRNALPVKLFEYFAAGLPVVASDYPEMVSLVGECGICVDPRDVGAVTDAIVTILSDSATTAKIGMSAR